MALAKLSIFVSGLDDPCRVSNRTWFITIFNCDGSVLEWCGRRYVVMRAPCGHLQVKVPPGCYYIKAVWYAAFDPSGGFYIVNHWTDAAIVTACCDETTCVKLFNPRAHRCGRIYLRAVRNLVAQKAIDRKAANQLEKAIKLIDGEIGEGADGKPFELDLDDDTLKKLIEEQEKQQE